MAKNTSLKQLGRLILTLAMIAGVVPPAQAGDWMPLLPDQDFYDFQLFAPPDLQEYAIRPSPNEGIFFTYERIYWGLTPPPSRGILNDFFIPVQPLNPFSVAQLNNSFIAGGSPSSAVFIVGSDPLRFDLNTNWMRTNMTWGNRFEGGWVYDDYGMLFNYYDSGPQSQSFATSNAYAVNSPTQTFTQQVEAVPGGLGAGAVVVVNNIVSTSPPPDHVITQTLTQTNSTELISGGFAATIRRDFSSPGSGKMNTARFSLGPKFLQLTDRYSINYGSVQTPFAPSASPASYSGPLQNGGWDTSAYNNIVGPEIGLNYQVERGRWTFETDLRFTAGMNWQNTLYRGSNFPVALGSDYFRSTFTSATVNNFAAGNQQTTLTGAPLYVQIYGVGQQNATNTADHNFVFSPLGEWRLRGRFKVSKAISLSVGYTGMWLAGITRASTNTEFTPEAKPVTTARLQNPALPPSPTNTWIPTNASNVAQATDLKLYNKVTPTPGMDQTYVFVNGIDFGLEVNY